MAKAIDAAAQGLRDAIDRQYLEEIASGHIPMVIMTADEIDRTHRESIMVSGPEISTITCRIEIKDLWAVLPRWAAHNLNGLRTHRGWMSLVREQAVKQGLMGGARKAYIRSRRNSP
ncbi:MAG: hypothetical protein C4586_08420 [Anaerolineaceae bacterium]|nr:MAG: hypothetical protein C4586_08420 [Anaerolineaceae bacterium]